MAKTNPKPESMSSGGKMNRTGIGASPMDGKKMVEAAEHSQPSSPGDKASLARWRGEHFGDAEPVGTVPPPASLKGILKTAADVVQGKKPTVFIDKIAERLAFERTGTRLYETLLAKYDAKGSFEGGPRREELQQFGREEWEHFVLLKQCLEQLGADPTAMTPSADLAAVESMGVLQVLNDPRTTVAESLHALLVAELADHEGWEMLVDLAEKAGRSEMAEIFRKANQQEEVHLSSVRGWLAGHAALALEREA